MAFQTIEDLYRGGLGRAPDAEGAAYWQQKFGSTIEPEEVSAFMAAAQPELAQRQAQANADSYTYQAQAAADRTNNSTPLAREQNKAAAQLASYGSSGTGSGPSVQGSPQLAEYERRLADYDQRLRDTESRYGQQLRDSEARLQTSQLTYQQQFDKARSDYESTIKQREADLSKAKVDADAAKADAERYRDLGINEQLSNLRGGIGRTAGPQQSEGASLTSGRAGVRAGRTGSMVTVRAEADANDSVLNRRRPVVEVINGNSGGGGVSGGSAASSGGAGRGGAAGYYARRFG